MTPRQQATAALLAHGLSNKQIANRMGLSVATVKQHLQGIYRSLGVNNRTQAALQLRRE